MNALEWRRKLFHFFMGIVLVVLAFYDIATAKVLLVFTSIMFVVFLIYKKKPFLPLSYLVEKFEREKLKASFPGQGFLLYLAGSGLSLLFFEKDIALAAIMILAVGDSIPNFVGVYFRRVKHPFSDRKFLEGMIAGIFFSFLGATLFVNWVEALVASVVALIVEGIDMKIGLIKVDDNFIVPLVAGTAIFLLRLLF